MPIHTTLANGKNEYFPTIQKVEKNPVGNLINEKKKSFCSFQCISEIKHLFIC